MNEREKWREREREREGGRQGGRQGEREGGREKGRVVKSTECLHQTETIPETHESREHKVINSVATKTQKVYINLADKFKHLAV